MLDPLERMRAEYVALRKLAQSRPIGERVSPPRSDPLVCRRLARMERYLFATFGPGWPYVVGAKEWYR
jgi:hypothetical protein